MNSAPEKYASRHGPELQRILIYILEACFVATRVGEGGALLETMEI